VKARRDLCVNVPADFARTLERELASANTEIAALKAAEDQAELFRNECGALQIALANSEAERAKADASARALCDTLQTIDDCWLIRPQSIALDIANKLAAELARQNQSKQ
jgi:hypothetical protein